MSVQPGDLYAQLSERLKELRLPAIRDYYQRSAQMAQQENLSYEQYLLYLIERECEVRRQNRVERFLRESRLPLEKTLATLDLTRFPQRIVRQLHTLLEGSFLDRSENVLAFGNPGSGKTHVVCAIGQELIRVGRRAYFTPCSLLVQDLLRAKQSLTLARLLKRLRKHDALIIDDIGYVRHNRDEMEVLFTLLADRYERGSVMVTSNLPFSQWERIFHDPMVTAAAIDRLVHHSIILELNIASYRMEQAKRKEVKGK
jgi:DNA replication protein DnaC